MMTVLIKFASYEETTGQPSRHEWRIKIDFSSACSKVVGPRQKFLLGIIRLMYLLSSGSSFAVGRGKTVVLLLCCGRAAGEPTSPISTVSETVVDRELTKDSFSRSADDYSNLHLTRQMVQKILRRRELCPDTQKKKPSKNMQIYAKKFRIHRRRRH